MIERDPDFNAFCDVGIGAEHFVCITHSTQCQTKGCWRPIATYVPVGVFSGVWEQSPLEKLKPFCQAIHKF